MTFLRFLRSTHQQLPQRQRQPSPAPHPHPPTSANHESPSRPPVPPSLSSPPQVFPTTTQVNAVALTPDSRYLAVGTNRDPTSVPSSANNPTTPNPTIFLFDTATNSLRTAIPHQSSVRAVSLNLDATILAVSDHTPVIRLFNPANPLRKTTLLGHSNQVDDVALSRSATHLASASCDTTVRLWDCQTGTRLHVLDAHSATVCAVTFCLNAPILLSAAYDSTLRVWDTRTAKQTMAIRAQAPLMDCAADPDGFIFVSCGEDRECNIWDARNISKPRKSLYAPSSLRGCDISHTASRVVVSGDAGLVKVWEVTSDTEIPLPAPHDRAARVRRCAISPDGRTVVTAGMDDKAVLFKLPSTPPPLDVIVDSAQTDVMPEIERLFSAFINEGTPLTTTEVVHAIHTDFIMERVKRLSTIYIGHLCVRRLISSGALLPDQQIPNYVEGTSTTTFFYQKLYHRISKVVTTQHELDYAGQILKNAAAAGIISEQDENSIIGDAQDMMFTRAQFSDLRKDINDLCNQVSSRIATIESRLEHLSFDVSTLRTRVDGIETKMERAEKVQRYANLVKFGLALIPFAGSAAMAFADGSANLIMSLDLEGTIELFSGLFSTTTQAVVDARLDGQDALKPAATETKEEQAVQVVQFVLSDKFLDRMERIEKQEFVSGLERRFGGNLDSLRSEVNKIIEQHSKAAENEEPSVEEPSEETPPVPLLENGEAACTVPDSKSIVEAEVVSSFREAVGNREKLSHGRACRLMKKVVGKNVQSSADRHDDSRVDGLIGETLIAETEDKVYSKVDEACFVRSAKLIAAILGREMEKRWVREFDQATDGEGEIDCTVAVRLIAGLVQGRGRAELAADQIKMFFGERRILGRQEFLDVAKSVAAEAPQSEPV